MPDVKIGDGAIVAARSVVSEVEPYTVVGGNPAKCLQQRFDNETVRSLSEIAWWNWDIDKITRNLKHITQADIAVLSACE